MLVDKLKSGYDCMLNVGKRFLNNVFDVFSFATIFKFFKFSRGLNKFDDLTIIVQFEYIRFVLRFCIVQVDLEVVILIYFGA